MGGVHDSLCPPSTCACMCAVNAGGCKIDLLDQGWASTSSLLCLVTGNNANTDNSSSAVPFVYPRIRLRGWQALDEKSPQILSNFSDEPPDRESNPGRSVLGKSVTIRPPRRVEQYFVQLVGFEVKIEIVDTRTPENWQDQEICYKYI